MSFRIQRWRHQLGLDVKADQNIVTQFALFLQAEMTTISLTTSVAAKENVESKVKQLQTTSMSSVAARPCKFRATAAGCTRGAKCKFGHSWEGVEDKGLSLLGVCSIARARRLTPRRAPRRREPKQRKGQVIV